MINRSFYLFIFLFWIVASFASHVLYVVGSLAYEEISEASALLKWQDIYDFGMIILPFMLFGAFITILLVSFAYYKAQKEKDNDAA